MALINLSTGRLPLDIVVSVNSVDVLELGLSDIISCSMDLRSVDTKFDNPELQVSTCEIVARCQSAEQFINQFMGRDTQIKINDRVFYCTLTADNAHLDREILTLRGVDGTAFIEGQYPGGLLEHPSDTTIMPFDTYARKIVEGLSFQATEDQGTYWGTTSATNPDLVRYMLMESKSYRKRIANFMNVFRGQTTYSSVNTVPRFVYRDAGWPLFWWRDGNNSATYYTGLLEHNMRAYTLSYADVIDLTTEYGNVIKEVAIDNPYVVLGSTSRDLGQWDMAAGQEIFVNSDDPVLYNGVSGVVGSYSGTQLSPYAIRINRTDSSSQAGRVTVKVRDINRIYNSNNHKPTIVSSGLAYGDTVELEPMPGLAQFATNVWPVRRAIEAALVDCNLRRPKWITFKVVPDPKNAREDLTCCQPRDFIIFTEENGTRNFYEVDNIQLDYSAGGVVSTIKAVYKCPA